MSARASEWGNANVVLRMWIHDVQIDYDTQIKEGGFDNEGIVCCRISEETSRRMILDTTMVPCVMYM